MSTRCVREPASCISPMADACHHMFDKTVLVACFAVLLAQQPFATHHPLPPATPAMKRLNADFSNFPPLRLIGFLEPGVAQSRDTHSPFISNISR